MTLVGFVRRFKTIRTLQYAARLIDNEDLADAVSILSDEIERDSSLISPHVLRGDCWLFQSENAKAYLDYKKAAALLDDNKKMSTQDRAFLNGYITFRKLTLAHGAGKKDIGNWRDIAVQINAQPASRVFKRLLVLPEPKT